MGWRLRRLGRGVTTLDDSACVSAALTLNRLTAPISACFPPPDVAPMIQTAGATKLGDWLEDAGRRAAKIPQAGRGLN